MARAVAFLRERQQLIMRIGGISMIIVGLLLVSGSWNTLTCSVAPVGLELSRRLFDVMRI